MFASGAQQHTGCEQAGRDTSEKFRAPSTSEHRIYPLPEKQMNTFAKPVTGPAHCQDKENPFRGEMAPVSSHFNGCGGGGG